MWTDQADYAPGSIVTISGDNANGAGYVEGNAVDVAVSGPNSWSSSRSGTVAANGSWSCTITLDSDPAVAVGDYSYTATSTNADGNAISENGTFTDAINPTLTISTDPTSTTPGGTFAVKGTLTEPVGSPPVATAMVGETVVIRGPTASQALCDAGAAGSPNNGALIGNATTTASGYTLNVTAPSGSRPNELPGQQASVEGAGASFFLPPAVRKEGPFVFTRAVDHDLDPVSPRRGEGTLERQVPALGAEIVRQGGDARSADVHAQHGKGSSPPRITPSGAAAGSV